MLQCVNGFHLDPGFGRDPDRWEGALQICREPVRGAFLERVNRYTASVRVGKKDVYAFIPTSGRLDDLLVPGVRCVLEPVEHDSRKTSYDLISVERDGKIVCIDTRIPQRFIEQSIRSHHLPAFRGYKVTGREVKCGESRLDLELRQNGNNAYVETRSVTRVRDRVALYPDTVVPSETSRLSDLTRSTRNGVRGFLSLIIQRNDADAFRPDRKADPEFAAALEKAARAGVRIQAFRCLVTDTEIGIEGEIPVLL
jgi:sugar fermentation stimulation protein A